MPVSFVKGDILEDAKGGEGGPRALAFPVDAGGTMEGGIASAVKTRWPEVAEALRAHAEGGKWQPGDVFASGDGGLRFYAMAMHRGGAEAKMSFVERAIRRALALAGEDSLGRVLVPRLGGGALGLDWTRVKKMLFEVASAQPIELVVYEQFVRSAK